MTPAEAARLARGMFERHCEECAKCARYDGSTRTLAMLCWQGTQLFKETLDPQRFGGQKGGRRKSG